MLTAFISFGGPDKSFAERLNRFLNDAGIQTFFFPKDAVLGEKLHHVMRNGISAYDRVIFICSKNSLCRPGVQNELEETLQREGREGGRQILIPITLDSFVIEEWNPEIVGLKQTILDRVIGDFKKAKRNKQNFRLACTKLLKALDGDLDIGFVSFDDSIFLEPSGKLTKLIITKKFIAYKSIKETHYIGLSSSGNIRPIRTSFGNLQPMTDEGGNKSVKVTFDEPLPINEVITHHLELLHEDAFLESIETHSSNHMSDCEEYTLHIFFPTERVVKDIIFKMIYKGVSRVLNDCININTDRSKIKIVVKFPLPGATYIAVWSW